MMRRIFISMFLTLIMLLAAPQQQEKTIEEIQKEEHQRILDMQEQYLQQEREIQELYQRYEQQISEEYQRIEAAEERRIREMEEKILAQWNDKKLSTNKQYVDYDKDLKSRSSVDFENGEVEIEVIQEEKDQNLITANKELENKLKDLITEKAPDNKSLLENQVKNKEGKSLSQKDADDLVDKYSREGKIRQEKIKGGDGKSRYKYTIKLKMVPDHLRIRLERYKNDIITYSQKFNIDPAMVCAIIHTESFFNPKARSHVPAYGLMQLVPKSGARDAYLYVHKRDRLLRSNYLYQPSNNIELGCGYLALLKYAYLKKISDETKNDLCAICAYNTGAGNVAYAINRTKNINKAAVIINSYDDRWLRKKLLSDLPYNETKNYLQKVTERRKIYQRAL
ncbi:MAG: murein transglycosylase domain-containing protein [Fidelibacterota bacterium]